MNTRVENGLYRGECVRSVLVPIGLEPAVLRSVEINLDRSVVLCVEHCDRPFVARCDFSPIIAFNFTWHKNMTQPRFDNVRLIRRDVA